MTHATELGEQLEDLRPLADGIAAHESAAADDLVGEEARSARREEVALVAAQAEEREAVVAVRAYEPTDEPPLVGGLTDTFGSGRSQR